MAIPYDRTRWYFELNDFVRIVGLKGEKAFFKIGMVETMAQQTALFADAIQGIDVPGATSDPDPVAFGFDEPVQDLRLIQVRPTIYPITYLLGVQPVLANIPPTLAAARNTYSGLSDS